MKCDRVLAHMTVRLAAGAEGPLPNLALPLLKCVEARGAGLPWYVRNTDVILQKPHTVATFNHATQDALSYSALLALLERVSVLNEITMFVPGHEITGFDLDEQLLRRDFTPFRICIDLRDSTEWTFYSDSAAELACATEAIHGRLA